MAVTLEIVRDYFPIAGRFVIARGAKTEAKASQKTPVTRAVVTGPALLAEAKDDLAAVGRIENLELVEGAEVAVQSIELGELPE